MNKIFLILFLLFFFGAKAQFPNNSSTSDPSTLQHFKGGITGDVATIVKFYSDTTTANNGKTDKYAGSLIMTPDSILWMRNVALTRWIQIIGGEGSLNILHSSNFQDNDYVQSIGGHTLLFAGLNPNYAVSSFFNLNSDSITIAATDSRTCCSNIINVTPQLVTIGDSLNAGNVSIRVTHATTPQWLFGIDANGINHYYDAAGGGGGGDLNIMHSSNTQDNNYTQSLGQYDQIWDSDDGAGRTGEFVVNYNHINMVYSDGSQTNHFEIKKDLVTIGDSTDNGEVITDVKVGSTGALTVLGRDSTSGYKLRWVNPAISPINFWTQTASIDGMNNVIHPTDLTRNLYLEGNLWLPNAGSGTSSVSIGSQWNPQAQTFYRPSLVISNAGTGGSLGNSKILQLYSVHAVPQIGIEATIEGVDAGRSYLMDATIGTSTTGVSPAALYGTRIDILSNTGKTIPNAYVYTASGQGRGGGITNMYSFHSTSFGSGVVNQIDFSDSIIAVTGTHYFLHDIDNASKVKFHNVDYSMPASQGAASTVLTNDGAGNLTWGNANPVHELSRTTINLNTANPSLTYTGLVGTFTVGEGIEMIHGGTGIIVSDDGTTIEFNTATQGIAVGSTITGLTSGATATVVSIDYNDQTITLSGADNYITGIEITGASTDLSSASSIAEIHSQANRADINRILCTINDFTLLINPEDYISTVQPSRIAFDLMPPSNTTTLYLSMSTPFGSAASVAIIIYGHN